MNCISLHAEYLTNYQSKCLEAETAAQNEEIIMPNEVEAQSHKFAQNIYGSKAKI